MDKRYQVFVSSTYTDLIEERQIVFQTLMEMDCIPAGMELFPAADEDQFEFIKKVIDDCDYYLLIVGGRYGTLAEDQISYTEKEFDYAVASGKKAVVLVHKDPDTIPSGKSESDPDIRKKLETFKKKAMTGRLVDFWEEPKDLRGIVAVSLNKTIKMFPAIGWVRGDKVANESLLLEANQLRMENETLQSQLVGQSEEIWGDHEQLDDFDAYFIVKYNDTELDPLDFGTKTERKVHEVKRSWRQLFRLIAPTAMNFGELNSARSAVYENISHEKDMLGYYARRLMNWDVIIAQMQGYRLINVEQVVNREGYTSTKIRLTDKGMKEYNRSLLVYKK